MPPSAGGAGAPSGQNWLADHKVALLAGAGGVGLLAYLKSRSSARGSASSLLGAGPVATATPTYGYDSSATDVYNGLESQIGQLSSQLVGLQSAGAPGTASAAAPAPKTPTVSASGGSGSPPRSSKPALPWNQSGWNVFTSQVGTYTSSILGGHAKTPSVQQIQAFATQTTPNYGALSPAGQEMAMEAANIGLVARMNGLRNPSASQIQTQTLALAGGQAAFAAMSPMQAEITSETANMALTRSLNPAKF